MLMALGKKNKVKVILENYTHLIIGERKVGKTTLVANLAKEHYGDIESILLISVGDEDGYKTIDGILCEAPKTWKELVKVVDELVKNPEENDFKAIALDTIDEVVKLAEIEVKRLHKIDKGTEAKSINDCFGGLVA